MTSGTDDGGRPPTFSQRHGYTPYPVEIQVESLDDRARTEIWNYIIHPALVEYEHVVEGLKVWTGHLGKPADTFSSQLCSAAVKSIVFEGLWYEVYNLIEFVVRVYPLYSQTELVERINFVLALNRAGYRVVSDRVIPVADTHEVSAIRSAAESPISNARTHIRQAVNLFAVRDSPNFPKVIHEAISAAEAAAQVLANKPGATLTDALTEVQKNSPGILHPALIGGWKQIYGFTSDSSGIRHAKKDDLVIADQDLAQYFLITCSAFVNWAAAVTAR